MFSSVVVAYLRICSFYDNHEIACVWVASIVDFSQGFLATWLLQSESERNKYLLLLPPLQ